MEPQYEAAVEKSHDILHEDVTRSSYRGAMSEYSTNRNYFSEITFSGRFHA